VPVAALITGPEPGDQVTAGLVVRSAACLEQPPCTCPHMMVGEYVQQPAVPRGEFSVGRFLRAAGEEDRGPYATALELPFVPQGRAS
jgi:hypothetical protein